MDRQRACRVGGGTVVIHGVAAEVQARGLLLHEHPLCGGVLRNIRQRNGRGMAAAAAAGHAEHVQLSFHIDLAAVGDGVQHLFIDLHQLGAVGSQTVIRFSTARLFISPQSNIRSQKS